MGSADLSDQFSILLNRGVLHLDAGSLEAASRDFERCIEVGARQRRRALPSPRPGTTSGTPSSWPAGSRGRWPPWRRRRAGRSTSTRSLLLDRARVLREAGLAHDADGILAQAAERFREAGLPQDLAETDLVRAECALVEGEAAGARGFARAAERVFVRRRNVQWQRKGAAARAAVRRLARRATASPARAAALRRLAARARRPGRGLPGRAPGRPGPVGRPAGARVPAAGRGRARPGAHRRAAHAGLRPAAGAHADPGGAGAGGAAPRRPGRAADRGAARPRRARLAPEPVRLARPAHRLRRARPAAGPARPRAARSATAARREFFAAVERGRAISIRLASVGPPKDARTAELLAALRQTEEEARGLEGDPAAGETLHRLRSRATSLQRDIRARAWELEGGPDGEGPGRRR